MPYTDFGARHYIPALRRWLVPDPKSEDYYDTGIYTYCAGDPVNLVDEDGRDIYIWYLDEKGQVCFHYSGKESDIPNNVFVQAVVLAYKYNKINWEKAGHKGSSPSTTLVEDNRIRVSVIESVARSSQYQKENGGLPVIYWNPYEGTKTDNGIVLSPATIFAHEADHAKDDFINEKAHSERVEKIDKEYSNQEEYRVISGSEQLTARANGEIGEGQITRFNHRGETVYTEGVTSQIIDERATNYYYKHVKK